MVGFRVVTYLNILNLKDFTGSLFLMLSQSSDIFSFSPGKNWFWSNVIFVCAFDVPIPRKPPQTWYSSFWKKTEWCGVC